MRRPRVLASPPHPRQFRPSHQRRACARGIHHPLPPEHPPWGAYRLPRWPATAGDITSGSLETARASLWVSLWVILPQSRLHPGIAGLQGSISVRQGPTWGFWGQPWGPAWGLLGGFCGPGQPGAGRRALQSLPGALLGAWAGSGLGPGGSPGAGAWAGPAKGLGPSLGLGGLPGVRGLVQQDLVVQQDVVVRAAARTGLRSPRRLRARPPAAVGSPRQRVRGTGRAATGSLRACA